MKPVFKKRLLTLILVGMAVLSMLAVDAAAASDKRRVIDEYQVKAAFLYNFIIYTQWPDSAFEGPQSPIKIYIYGPDALSDAFDPLVKKVIGKRKIVVHYKETMDPLDDGHVAFFAKTTGDVQRRELSKNKILPILTIGETPGFARQGGMINFVLAGNKVRFEINPSTAQQAGLKISSKLLNLATIVEK